jgi:hypothetical protein
MLTILRLVLLVFPATSTRINHQQTKKYRFKYMSSGEIIKMNPRAYFYSRIQDLAGSLRLCYEYIWKQVLNYTNLYK